MTPEEAHALIDSMTGRDERQPQPLSGPEIVQGIEIALSHITDRYVEKVILAAHGTPSAIAIAKKECRWFGYSGDGLRVRGDRLGIRISCEEREGIVTWSALVDWVRGGKDAFVAKLRADIEATTRAAVQLTLF